MQVVNKLELKLEEIKECHIVLNMDCPVGRLYDFSCALMSFCIEKMNEAKPKPEKENKD